MPIRLDTTETTDIAAQLLVGSAELHRMHDEIKQIEKMLLGFLKQCDESFGHVSFIRRVGAIKGRMNFYRAPIGTTKWVLEIYWSELQKVFEIRKFIRTDTATQEIPAYKVAEVHSELSDLVRAVSDLISGIEIQYKPLLEAAARKAAAQKVAA